jgi:predicted nucleic acid-binding protein
VTAADRATLQPTDTAQAGSWLRRLDLVLRTPDALHLAIAARLGAPVATFDRGMEAAARNLGLRLAPA